MVVAITFFIYDLSADVLLEGEFGSWHFFIETAVFCAVAMALGFDIRDFRRARSELRYQLRRNAMFSTALAESIDAQFEAWTMTQSEKEVAWLVLKGFRFAEIACLHGVKEATARLQASAAYAKAEVSGRAEFVAEIIQQLLAQLPKDAPAVPNSAAMR